MDKDTDRKRRPPSSKAPARGETRDRLMQIGMEIVSERGFSATGIELVLKHAEVPKGSFYYYFKSKDDFGLAVIDSYAEYFAHRLQRIFQNASLTPMEQLSAFIDGGAAGLRKFEFRRGCLVGTMGQELSILSEEIRHRLETVIQQWEVCVEHCLRAALDRGQVRPTLEPATASRYFWIGWEGAILRAKLSQSIEPIEVFRSQFFEFLGCTPPTGN